MNIQDILTLYDYNYWATRRILTAGAHVGLDQFLAPAAHSHGGLRGTLVHTLDTEYGWRMLCQNSTAMPDMAEAAFPTLQALEQRWREEEQAMRAYLGSLTDDELAGHVRYTTSSGQARERVLWHCLLHVVNHGTQHRSEAAAILTGYGHSPGDLDFTLFLSEQT
ncbi:MAG: DinB family protein [Roseiflexaceae bacterium]